MHAHAIPKEESVREILERETPQSHFFLNEKDRNFRDRLAAAVIRELCLSTDIQWFPPSAESVDAAFEVINTYPPTDHNRLMFSFEYLKVSQWAEEVPEEIRQRIEKANLGEEFLHLSPDSYPYVIAASILVWTEINRKRDSKARELMPLANSFFESLESCSPEGIAQYNEWVQTAQRAFNSEESLEELPLETQLQISCAAYGVWKHIDCDPYTRENALIYWRPQLMNMPVLIEFIHQSNFRSGRNAADARTFLLDFYTKLLFGETPDLPKYARERNPRGQYAYSGVPCLTAFADFLTCYRFDPNVLKFEERLMTGDPGLLHSYDKIYLMNRLYNPKWSWWTPDQRAFVRERLKLFGESRIERHRKYLLEQLAPVELFDRGGESPRHHSPLRRIVARGVNLLSRMGRAKGGIDERAKDRIGLQRCADSARDRRLCDHRRKDGADRQFHGNGRGDLLRHGPCKREVAQAPDALLLRAGAAGGAADLDPRGDRFGGRGEAYRRGVPCGERSAVVGRSGGDGEVLHRRSSGAEASHPLSASARRCWVLALGRASHSGPVTHRSAA